MSDYTEAIKRLFPRGLAWDNNPIKDALAAAFAKTLKALDLDAKALFLEKFATKQKQSLGEWENQLALPDRFSIEDDTLYNRGFAVVAKNHSMGGQSNISFHDLAKAYGFKIQIITFPALICGVAVVGETVGAAPLEATIKILDYADEAIHVGEYIVGSNLPTDEKLTNFIGACNRKIAAYGKLHFVTEV